MRLRGQHVFILRLNNAHVTQIAAPFIDADLFALLALYLLLCPLTCLSLPWNRLQLMGPRTRKRRCSCYGLESSGFGGVSRSQSLRAIGFLCFDSRYEMLASQ